MNNSFNESKCNEDFSDLQAFFFYRQASEAVFQSFSVKKVLLKISQNSQENLFAEISF